MAVSDSSGAAGDVEWFLAAGDAEIADGVESVAFEGKADLFNRQIWLRIQVDDLAETGFGRGQRPSDFWANVEAGNAIVDLNRWRRSDIIPPLLRCGPRRLLFTTRWVCNGTGSSLSGSGRSLRKGLTVFDDLESDVLTGSSGSDWFFFGSGNDTPNDRKNTEAAN